MSISSAPARVSGLFSFTAHLTKARFASRQGESLLYLAAIMAFIISSALALTVAGGTWMFYYRWQHPHGLLLEVLAEDSTFDIVPQSYFIPAVFACALLIPATYSLASGAAVLGARGRERRLAALRLLGLSSGDVTQMALIDTLLQATIGHVHNVLINVVGIKTQDALWQHVLVVGFFKLNRLKN